MFPEMKNLIEKKDCCSNVQDKVLSITVKHIESFPALEMNFEQLSIYVKPETNASYQTF